MRSLCIRGGTVIDPSNKLNQQLDLYIDAAGRVAALGTVPADWPKQQDELDAKGCYVFPGLVDLNTRLREPGSGQKGNITSETRAALYGGYSYVCAQPDTQPVVDQVASVELIHHRAGLADGARVAPLGAITRNLEGQRLSEFAALLDAGCVAISDAQQPIRDSNVLRHAMEYAHSCGATLFLQPLDPWLAQHGCAHEGAMATRLGLSGIPVAAETVGLARLLELAAHTGARVHLCAVSAERSLNMIARAKQEGLPITVSVDISQLHLCEQDIDNFNTAAHLQPPLRSARDRDALRQALADGLIDAISSGHAPHDRDAKFAPFEASEAGASTIEHCASLVFLLIRKNLLSLTRAIDALSSQPAKIAGLPAGNLAVGATADICILNPDIETQISSSTMRSQGKSSPFEGWRVPGKMLEVLKAGRRFKLD